MCQSINFQTIIAMQWCVNEREEESMNLTGEMVTFKIEMCYK